MSAIDFFKPLPPSILDIEEKTRGNLFSWRGQFSPQLIESLLKAYCPDNAVVFDPFGGSGTVLYECALMGKEAYSTELNPAAWLLSRTYELANLTIKERREALLMVQEFFSAFLFARGGLNRVKIVSLEELRLMTEDFNTRKKTGAEQQIFSSAMILFDAYARIVTHERVAFIFSQLTEKIMDLPKVRLPVKSYLADARKVPFKSDSFDFVITSPPYINVFNYHQNYRVSAEVLGWDLLKVARSEIGSNRANRGNRFLTVVQYCLDMESVLRELHRVCKESAKVILVVGRESSVLGVSWQNSAIVRQLAEGSGHFECGLVQERKFRNKFGVTIYEDLLHLTPKTHIKNVKSVAKTVAQSIFEHAIVKAEDKVLLGLKDAAAKIATLEGTSIFELDAKPSSFSLSERH